jgi:hypothetical protein
MVNDQLVKRMRVLVKAGKPHGADKGFMVVHDKLAAIAFNVNGFELFKIGDEVGCEKPPDLMFVRADKPVLRGKPGRGGERYGPETV